MCSKQGGRRQKLEEEVEANVDHATVPSIPAICQRLQVYKLAQIEDSECLKTREFCKTQSIVKANLHEEFFKVILEK